MNESGKLHIVLIDEVDMNNVGSKIVENHTTVIDIDLSYLSEFENVKFIICIRNRR